MIEFIRRSVVGERELVDGPFGSRPVVYADYTASGRSLSFIEDFIRDAVLPLYANTHTESSGTGRQTTRLREQSRDIIRRCLGATDEHVVLFCGSGSTGAIDRLIRVLGIRLPRELDRRHGLSAHVPAEVRPVVFIGPYEHHSNELPWRESIADVVTIPEDGDGQIDQEILAKELDRHAERPLKIGSFSAASNVTGILSDVAGISALLHSHGARAFWDYAAAAPYVQVEMGSASDGPSYLDAIFISPHKLIGGPGTPGLLVARRELFDNEVPAVPGGGTVSYVSPEEHHYLADPEHREEGGTPAIVESIRAGLVFKLKEAVGYDRIRSLEEGFIHRAIEAWSANPRIEILGNPDADRLSIVSLIIRHDDRYLHHNYVVAVLNDLFGIQARGGCSCAGPYGHSLLGIDMETSHRFEEEILLGCEGIKPGWVRVNFNYFIAEETFQYIVEAVNLIAEHGVGLLPSYRFDPDSALWTHEAQSSSVPLDLDEVAFTDGGVAYELNRPEGSPLPLAEYLERGREVLAEAARRHAQPDRVDLSDEAEKLRWFPLPEDVARA